MNSQILKESSLFRHICHFNLEQNYILKYQDKKKVYSHIFVAGKPFPWMGKFVNFQFLIFPLITVGNTSETKW